MIVALSLLACTTSTDPGDPGDPIEPTPTAIPVPPLSELAVQSEHGEGHVTFSEHPELESGWSVDLALIGAGRRGETEPTPVAPVVENHRATYSYSGFTEWYEATDAGTKHGLEITSKPAGDGNLRYRYQVSSELFPVQADNRIVFLDANDQVRFNYADIYTFDANGDEVPSWMQLDCTDTCTISLVVDDADAVYPLTIDPLAYSDENVLLAPTGRPNTGIDFGRSVDIRGEYAIVGARLADSPSNNRGEAYIYRRVGTSWSHVSTLQAIADGRNSDNCGFSVALSDGRALVGCIQGEPNTEPTSTNWGEARVYRRDTPGSWPLEAVLPGIGSTYTGPSPNPYDSLRQGYSVDLNEGGTRAIIGGWGTNSSGSLGVASVFERSGTTWTRISDLTGTGVTSAERFGWSVGISDTLAIVGSPNYDDGSTTATEGRVFLFSRDTGPSWNPDTSFIGNSSVRTLGYSVAVDGTRAVAGAPQGEGAIQVYTKPGSSWSLQQTVFQLSANPSDRFGNSVGIDNDRIVVGASRDDSGTTDNRGIGSVVVLDFDGSTWNQEAEFLTRESALDAAGDEIRIGSDVGVSGSWTIGGTIQSDNADLETAHVFRVSDCSTDGVSVCDYEILITEIHADPSGGFDEEYIELYNNGTAAVQLQGATVSIASSASFPITDSFVVLPGEHVIIAKSSDSTVNGGIAGIPGMYVDNTWTLDDTADTVTLTGADGITTLATVTYAGFATPSASLQLGYDNDIGAYRDPAASYTATSNGNWCPTFGPRVPGDNSFDFSTPRQTNEDCGRATQPMGDLTGTISFDFTYLAASGPVDNATGTTYITLLGNLFTTGNSGEGVLTWGATATGQTLTVQYTGTGVELTSSAERAFGDSCFTAFTANPATFPGSPPGPAIYIGGGWTGLVCN